MEQKLIVATGLVLFTLILGLTAVTVVGDSDLGVGRHPDVDNTPPPIAWDEVLLLLPDCAQVRDQTSADLDGDGALEAVVLVGYGGGSDRLGYDAMELFVIEAVESGYDLAWHSFQLIGTRAEKLDVVDVNGEGPPEVLSKQSMGAAGETLYILGWRDGAYDFLRPDGGPFDGESSFGADGVSLADDDGDGVMEIVATYHDRGPSVACYRWNGERYAHDGEITY